MGIVLAAWAWACGWLMVVVTGGCGGNRVECGVVGFVRVVSLCQV